MYQDRCNFDALSLEENYYYKTNRRYRDNTIVGKRSYWWFQRVLDRPLSMIGYWVIHYHNGNPVSNRTSDECMKSNQDHRKFRVQCTSGVFCWVHERSECTLQNTKICTVLWIYGGRDLISSMNYVCNCECVPIRWSTNVLSVRVKHSDIFFFMYGSI